MSYYKAICLACPDKSWIKPGTEDSVTPQHEGRGYEHDGSREANGKHLDADHQPVAISVGAGMAQQRMLDQALEIIRKRVPGAVQVDLETSDQDRYGFVLTSVKDESGSKLLPRWDDVHHPLAGVSDDVNELIGDLNWNGVVGEGDCGYVTLDVRTGDVVASS